VLEKLLTGADIVIHSVRTEAAARIGLGYERLKQINPRLVVCHGKGYLDEGLYGGRPAYDDVIQAESGFASLQSVVANEPRFVPSIVADKITATQVAYAAVVALFHREKTGNGQYVEIPMFETLAAFNMHEHLWGQTFVPALAPTGYTPITSSSRRPFKTADGYLCVLPIQDIHWKSLCAILGESELANDARYATYLARQANQHDYWTLIGSLVARLTTAEWVAALTKADIPFGHVNTTEDLLTDPHLQSVGFWEIHEHPSEGTIRMAGIPFRMSESPPSIRRTAPRLGEHTLEVARELGYSEADISRLQAKGAFGSGPAA
jgi:formyl-CoA transferase